MDEQILPVPFLGSMSIKQIALLMGAFFISFGLYQIDSLIYCPIFVIPAFYFSFARGKTFSPMTSVLNYFLFLIRTSGLEKKIFKNNKPKTVKSSNNILPNLKKQSIISKGVKILHHVKN